MARLLGRVQAEIRVLSDVVDRVILSLFPKGEVDLAGCMSKLWVCLLIHIHNAHQYSVQKKNWQIDLSHQS